MKSLKQIQALPFVEFKQRKHLPHTKGVYFVVFEAKLLVYVGMTLSGFCQRWRNHSVGFACKEIILLSDDWQWKNPLICIHYQDMSDCTNQEIYQVEQKLIKHFQRPIWNATQGGKPSLPILEMFGTRPHQAVDKLKQRQEESDYWETVHYCRRHNIPFERREEFHIFD